MIIIEFNSTELLNFIDVHGKKSCACGIVLIS
jgi:hypothetical protein